jgi:DNA-binding NarL/FixJ family response regulator
LTGQIGGGPVGTPGIAQVAVREIAARLADIRVVVVDDKLDRRQLMRQVVEVSADEVAVVGFAESATSAVETVDRLDANAVLIEIQIPVDEGLAVIAALRYGRPTLRIIVCSFHSDGATKKAALAAGADAYVTKPVSSRDLRRLLRTPSGS